MADSQTDSKFFSVRIVSIDYYMTAPLPGFDICYSSFQGGRVNEVPVIRVYGATPAGQKTCLHLHGALPYFYVPCSEIFLQSDEKGSECTNALALALEKVLKLKGNAGSKRQHVHGCSLVRARKFYGYHSSEELFLKIYLYHPQDVSRAANLLLGGAVQDKSLQPHESHIPFLLQFLVDYNLYGMGHLHVSKMKFRNPIPDTYSPRNVDRGRPSVMPTSTTAEFRVDLDGETCFDTPIWISSTIPDNWMWKYSSQADPSTDPNIPNIKRQSISELEGDASVDAIMNQQLISYMSPSQTCSQEKMVQSLIPIWEEEFASNGVHEVGLPPDPGKPLRDDVLRTLSHGIGYEEILMELSNDVKVSSDMLQSINSSMDDENIANIGHCRSLNSIREPSRCPEEGLFQDHVLQKRLETDACPKQLLADQLEATVSVVASQDVKASDQDALRLLNWLASSQAAEDINSDDDLARETILSPLMPATTINTVLEKANVAYENESQQECEDILDSVHDCYFEELDRKTSQSISNDHSCRSSSSMLIPQLDGSNDDPSPISFVNESSETHKKPGTSSQADSWNKAPLATTNKHKKKKPGWCSLPIVLGQNLNDSHPNPVARPSSHIYDERDGRGTSSDVSFNKYPNFLSRSLNESANCEMESSMIVECSTRDLMRVKRSYQAEPYEYGNQVKKVQLVVKGKEDSFLYSESSHDEKDKMPCDSLISRSAITDQPRECHERNSCLALQMEVEPGDIKADKSNSPSYHKLPLVSSSMQEEDASKDGLILSSVGHHVEVDSRASAGLLNCGMSGASTSQGNKEFEIPDVENKESAIYMGSCSRENVDSCMKCTEISNPDLFTSTVAPHSRFTSETEGKFPDCGKLLQMNAVSLSQSPVGPSHSKSTVTSVSGDVLELKGMTFIKKPPKVEFTDEPGRGAQSACGTPSYHVNKKNKTRTCAQDRGLDEFLPFFEGNCFVGEKISRANCGTSNYVHCQDNLLGVPIHFQNDGSYLYMLTPAYSPPQSESVRRWLSLDCADSSKMNVTSGPSVYPSTKVCSDDVAEPQDSQSTFCDQPLMDSASASEPNPNQLQANKNCLESNSPQMNPVVPDARIKQQDEEIILNCESSMRVSQDLSQISGPDRKSRLTPLSQTGFRDPASIGCGQQLTILSIEVQAESRGDLRPDPRFDAVRIVVLVFQEDDDFRSDTHVLLHCNGESVQRELDGVSECKVLTFFEERLVFFHFIKMINSFDPDILMGWDIQGGSLGFLAERAAYLGIGLLNKISRTPSEGNVASRDSEGGKLSDIFSETVAADPMFHEDAAIIDDEWGRTHASGVHVGGRIVLNIWRLMRGEVKLNLYTLEAVAEAVLRRKFPYIPNKVLTNWFLCGPGRARYRCILYLLERAKLNLQIMNQLDVVNRTSELARIFGIDFFSVLSRGSQYRVESMFLRLAHAQNYVAISPGNQQVASQPAMECIPLVMEPKSGFYADPVVVLDFQSLYPSMIIAYNLCFCTCLGKVTSTKANILGVSSYSPDKSVMNNLKDEILLTPNGVMYVPPRVRKGVLPRLLEEILDTRIMVKTAMKKLPPGQQVLHRIFNARQLALKLIANVTYGYTAAGFSGRMPCAELADSIVQCGRRTLESAISFVNTNHRWNAKVIYGDTDSMFVLLEGRSIEEAFRIGHEIASEVTAMNPNPVTLKMEKVYHSCFLLTKKRYVGYSYDNVDQSKPVFDAKGIETVRRDTCGAVSKIMERSLRVFFEYRDIEKVKSYLVRQWKKIISGRVSLQDFVFAKEVRLGTYSAQGSSLPPAAIVATKAMRVDPRAEPRYAERVPYVVVHGEPGARLADVVVDPLDVLSIDSPYRLNDIYYIKKQIIPALQRVFGLVRADLNQWFSDMPRPEREAAGKRHLFTANAHRTRIDYYYLSKHCIICGELIQASSYVCQNCSRNEVVVAAALTGRTSVLERTIQHLAAICRHCGGGDWLIESGVKCTSLACSVFYERRKTQKELRSLSAVTTEAGFYPRSLSRQDLQILVGYGCPSTDKKVVFSSKLLRKHAHLDEGDVCSSCNLRSSCERAYLLTNKEDETRTIDVMRVLLTYGFDAINGSVANESLLKKKSVKTVVRKLLHEVVKLSAVPIDPNLPPPVFKKPPPKVKQPPPPPRKRVGRDDIEMKKGDWLCPKCDFMNFAKNTICLQCDANRPKRQLLPGEWECSQCNFLNYRRNVVCFHCECKRPADDYMVAQQLERQQGSRTQMDKISRRQDVSNAWNFDFDDDESDGADIATFENADSQKLDEDFPLDRQERRDTSRSNEDGFYKSSRPPKGYETEYPAPGKPGLGFNDFDDEEDDVDNYEIDSNGANRSSRIDFSDIEVNSESEDIDSVDDTSLVGRRNSSPASDAHFRPRHQKGAFHGSEDEEMEFDTDDELPIKTNMKSSKVSYSKPRSRNKGFNSDDDYGLSSDSDDRDFVSQHNKGNKWGSRGDFGRRRSFHSEDEPFSDSESNKGRSFHKNKQRGGKVGQNGRWDSSKGRGDRIRDKRTSFRDNMKRSPKDSHGSSRRSQDYGYNDYRSRGREESYKQPRGRNSNYRDQSDSYLDDERHRRPRINVR